MLQYFSRPSIVPAGGGNTDKKKKRYLGFRGSPGKGWRAQGSEPPSSLLGAGESSFPWKKWLPLGEVPPRGGGSATLAGPQPPPLPVLADPTARGPAVPLRLLPAAHAQLFVCCWSFSKKKRRNRQEDGAEEGETRRGKRCTFAAVVGPRAGLLFAEAAKPAGLRFRSWGSGRACSA